MGYCCFVVVSALRVSLIIRIIINQSQELAKSENIPLHFYYILLLCMLNDFSIEATFKATLTRV